MSRPTCRIRRGRREPEGAEGKIVTEWRVRICDLRASSALRQEIHDRLGDVLERGWYILGEEVKAFEEEFAAYLGVNHVVGAGSGTDAIHLALRAEGIGGGDEVLTTPMTAVPTACGIALSGARPTFADIDPGTGLLDVEDAERRITPRTRAVIPVHLYGECVPMDEILALARRHNLIIIEDAAQAHGARWKGRAAGTWGEYGCFSFYPTKNLGACGDGGAVVTPDPRRAEAIRRLRNYGQVDRYRHESDGWNSRLDEMQAAVLRVKLPRLDEANETRRRLAARYRERLAGAPVEPLRTDPRGVAVHHLLVVRCPDRDRLREELAQRGIESQIHYPIPVHLQAAFQHLGYTRGAFPRAETFADQILTLPLYPELPEDDVDTICAAVRDILPAREEA
ncbi:MAG: aminotransferase class V-fold PLP-dependent enzyme [Candidatus Eisenbacteria bacterium]|nr:aminotransferase class V-fold PLP-dependent enzyme [Candidatus Eisenbacteria bacterium]